MDVLEAGFSSRLPPARREAGKAAIDPERVVTSREGNQVVGVADSVPVKMTLPGALVEPVAGVIGVAVRPTHRRQGRLRSMMRYQLDQLREWGDHTAVLTASESRIYQRFGYGPATLASSYLIDKRQLGLEAVTGAKGRVRLLDGKTAAASFPAMLTAHQATRAGEVSRTGFDWKGMLNQLEPEHTDDQFYVRYEENSRFDGYAIYRVVSEGSQPRRRTVQVVELCTLSKAAYLGLWSYLIGLDLVAELRTGLRPVDEPLRWALSDYRRMRTEWTSEHTYLRLVDVERALGKRRYEEEGTLTLRVRDTFCPWNAGSYRLSIGAEGEAEVERCETESADLALDVSTLGSIYLGGLRPGALGAVGLIEELRPGALERADRSFVGPEPPFCTTQF